MFRQMLSGVISSISRVNLPEDVTPDRISFARARMKELIPDTLVQSFRDGTEVRHSTRQHGLPRDESKAEVSSMFLAGNMLAVSRFLDELPPEDRALLNCLPSARKLSPELEKALGRSRKERERIYQTGALITLLEEMATDVQPSLAAVRIAELSR